VSFREDDPSAPEPHWEWRLTHSERTPERWDEAGTFVGRLSSALRAGHGIPVAFDLVLTSGPVPQLTLGCTDPSSARWVTRVLLPAYGRSAWVRVDTGAPDRWADLEWGRRLRPWPDPLQDSMHAASGLDRMALAVRTVPRGYSVRWSLVAHPPSWRSAPTIPGPPLEPPSRPPVDRTGHVRPATKLVPFDALPGRCPLFWKATVCLRGHRGGRERTTEAPAAVRNALEGALRTESANGLRFSRAHLGWPWRDPSFPVSEDELVGILPTVACPVEGVETTPSSALSILPLGRTSTGRVVGPPVELGEGRHLAVLGETGMGKSSTLVAVARKASRLGGVVLFDPLGETAADFREGLSPEERERLVWISPREPTSTINALEGIGRTAADPVLSDRRLNDIVHALRRVRAGRYIESSFWGPRLEEMLTRAIAAAAAFPSGTLADAHTLLATGGRTRQVVPPEAQELVRELADRVRDRPEDADGARRLLFEVVRSPVLERMLCSRTPTHHASDLTEPGRIAIVSGEASSVGESTSRYLLAVYLALVWSELLAREPSTKTFVVLDESQWFSHESLAEMLRLARRRNVHVVLATQTVGSLPEPVADAVWTNVSDFVAFRGSPEEARELSRSARGLSMEELLALPRGHAAVLLGKGGSLEWVRTTGRPASKDRPAKLARFEKSERLGMSREESVREVASVSPDQVLDWIRSRARPDVGGGPIEVPLDELRHAVDPEGGAIRAAGAILGRAGAIVSSRRSERGSVWILDPTRIPGSSGDRRDPSSLSNAEGPQLS